MSSRTPEDRDRRRAEALRENLRRRKAQARHAIGDRPDAPGGCEGDEERRPQPPE